MNKVLVGSMNSELRRRKFETREQCMGGKVKLYSFKKKKKERERERKHALQKQNANVNPNPTLI